MSEKGVKIIYGEIAPGAKESFVPSSSYSQFNTLHQLQENNLKFKGYANPCELYQTVLDGRSPAFPSNPERENIGLWSSVVSDYDGIFPTTITLRLKSDLRYSSSGITLTFDTDRNIYPTDISITWYRVSNGKMEHISSSDFTPDSSVYFCEHSVEGFNRVDIMFFSMNMPNNRLKLRAIDYGRGITFSGDELKRVKLTQEIDPISSEIVINTADFELVSNQNADYFFQKKQPISVYYNGELKATEFVRTAKRKSENTWSISSEDYVGIMDAVPFYGGMYEASNRTTAYKLLQEIFDTAGVPYSINEGLKNTYVYGHIPITTCREAAMQVAFAVQNVIDTSNSDRVNVYQLSDEVTQTIPLNRIMQGQNFDDEDTVTAVEVAYHKYVRSGEEVVLYSAEEDGVGQNIFVKFSEPIYRVWISAGEGDIVYPSTDVLNAGIGINYAIINAREGCVLTGKNYRHTVQTKRQENPNVGSGELERVLSIQNATLVSQHNIDDVLGKCCAWLTKKRSVNMKVVEGKHKENGDTVYDMPINVGDVIITETEYLGNLEGRVVKQSFNLNGGIIVKEAVVK